MGLSLPIVLLLVVEGVGVGSKEDEGEEGEREVLGAAAVGGVEIEFTVQIEWGSAATALPHLPRRANRTRYLRCVSNAR